jgi:signal transduction histidine kinase
MRIAGLAGAYGSLLIAAPAPASAATVGAAIPEAGLYGMVAAAALSAASFAVLWRRSVDAHRRDQAKRNAENARAELIAKAVDQGALGYLVWDKDGDVAAAGGILAAAEAEDELSSVADRLAPGQAELLRTAISSLRNQDRDFEIELSLADADGRWRARGLALPDEGGRTLWLDDIGRLRQRIGKAEDRADKAESGFAGIQAYFDCLTTPLYERDSDDRIVWCNRAYASIVGVEQSAVSESEAEIESAMNRGDGARLAARARESGKPEHEIRHFVVGGQRRALEITEVPGLPGGHTAGVVVDVSSLEERETELRRHVDAHAEVLNNLSTSIAIFGPDRHLTYYNSAFVNLWRLDEDWLETQPLHGEILDRLREMRLLPEVPDFPAYKQEAARLYTNLLETQEEIIYLPSSRVLRRVISPHPMGGISILDEDITDSLALERSFNTLTAVQQETIENLHEGVAVFGSDGRLKLFNPAYARLCQIDPEQLADDPHVSEILDRARPLFDGANDQQRWKTLRERLISQTMDREARSGRMEFEDGGVVDFVSIALPDGNTLFSYVDVTDSVNVERVLRERNQALEAADELKSEFLSSVSYELRTPLNVIIGFAEVLVNEYFGELNERQMEYGRDILNSSQQLLALINDILDLASIEAGRLELEIDTIEIELMIQNVFTLARERAQRRQMQMQIEIEPDIGSMQADERRLKQAIFNLVSNSLKYTPVGGSVSLGARRHGDEIEFYVSDSGVGIHEDDRELIFESFQRGRFGDSEHSAGLGLSLVKHFTELHGGHVAVNSTVGVGTTISMFLPASPADAVAPDAPAARRDPGLPRAAESD